MIKGLLMTLSVGLFFLIGGLISLKIKNKARLNIFSCGLAFIVILGLIFSDLGPEVLELLDNKLIGLLYVILGFLILAFLDIFIPAHTHHHQEKNDDKNEHLKHIHHIGIITIISLILHNILEGVAIYGISLNDFKAGLLITLSVALHNIPLGTHIFSFVDLKKNKLLVFLLMISSLLGALLFILIGNVSDIVMGVISAITLGMLIYIAIWEILPEIIKNRRQKEVYYGLGLGLILIFISILI